MTTGLEVRSAKFEDAHGSMVKRAFEMNNTVHIARACTIVRGNNESGSLLRCKSEERLRKTPMMKSIRRKISKLAKAVDENSRRIAVADRLRDLRCDGLAFDLGRRKDVVGLVLEECF